MRPLGGPQEKKKVKQNLTNPRTLDPRKAGKSVYIISYKCLYVETFININNDLAPF
jgi:hypothetical protein